MRKLSFTGSAEVGTALLRDSAAQAKHVTLELGGHAPFIVLADADLDAAVEGAVRSKFRNSGQTCVCLNRIYVERPAYDEFRDRFAERVAELRAGDPLDEATEVGPLIDAGAARPGGAPRRRRSRPRRRAALRRPPDRGPGARAGLSMRRPCWPTSRRRAGHARGDLRPGRAAGAGRLRPRRRSSWPTRCPGAWPPTSTPAIPSAASRLADSLDYGVVGVNDPLPAAPHLPFGGIKRSGLGKEGGRAGIEEFLETQLVSTAPR